MQIMVAMSTPAPEFLRIVERATAAQMPVRDLLHEANIAQTTWWRWQQGRTEPRLKSLRDLDQVLRRHEAPEAQAA